MFVVVIEAITIEGSNAESESIQEASVRMFIETRRHLLDALLSCCFAFRFTVEFRYMIGVAISTE